MVAVAKQDALSARRSMVDDLLRELRDHAKRVGGARDVHLVETHISWVLVGPEVYKIKKPVSFPFLDFASFEERERACRNEVRVNRRLAPRVYLGVVPIRRRPDGRFTLEAGGPVVEWAVRMRRLDEDRRADHLLTADRLDGATVDRLAHVIASFHAGSPTGPRIVAMGSPAVVEEHVRENFAALHALAEGVVAPDALAEIERRQIAFLRGHPERFEARMKAGAIRDGHGDLRLEHVFVRDREFEIIDGIEFDDRYRWGDVAADVAFLAMDLARLGRTDLAERFVAAYARASGDFDIYDVLDFYESYRACIRAKIVAASAPDEARRCLLLALSLRQRNIVPPMLVCVGGGLADAVGDRMSAAVVDADCTRFSEAEVLRRAGVVLASGRPVVIAGALDRAKARGLAERHSVPFRCVEATAADATALERVLADLGAWPPGLTG
jgi:aminoglycoside phosphotransferase family enzyme